MGIKKRFPAISAGSHVINSIRIPNARGSRNVFHLLSIVFTLYVLQVNLGNGD